MTHPVLRALALAAALLGAGAASAQTALAPQAQRIDDRTIDADQRGYEAVQARIKALNDGGRPLRDHHLAKAQCWLDTSFHEYTRNDRGPWPQAALDESDKLLRAMEARQSPLPDETPLVAGAERLRPDLWQRSATLRAQPGWRCAQAKAACAEVELVHAGHEQVQLGWRHARPYVQLAEDLLDEAEAQARACPAPVHAAVAPAVVVAPAAAAAPPAPTPAPAPPPAVVTVREPAEVQLLAQVVFRFDRHGIGDIPAGGLVTLQALLQRLRDERLVLQDVLLSGHADRLRSAGRPEHNQWLSERRVAAVRDFLVEQGVPAARIRVEALGDRQPRAACDGSALRGAALQDCLLPDRRVELTVTTRRP